MVRRVSEAAGEPRLSTVSMRFVSICISVTIINSFIRSHKVSEEEETCVSS